MDAALAWEQESAPAPELVEALAYRAELAIRTGDAPVAVDLLTRARAIPLTAAERSTLAAHLAGLEDLAAVIGLTS